MPSSGSKSPASHSCSPTSKVRPSFTSGSAIWRPSTWLERTSVCSMRSSLPRPDRALAAALRMREAMRTLNDGRSREELLLKIGIHEGPCLAVVLNDRQDYFGTTVNIAARVQALAESRAILATKSIVADPQAAALLETSGVTPTAQSRALRGIADEVPVYEIP